jgi:hypothetical protein
MLMTFVSKCNVECGDSEDRERWKHPPAPRRPKFAAAETAPELHLSPAASAIRQFFHARVGNTQEMQGSIRKLVEI